MAYIVLDEQDKHFHISPQKHMLLVLIRTASVSNY